MNFKDKVSFIFSAIREAVADMFTFKAILGDPCFVGVIMFLAGYSFNIPREVVIIYLIFVFIWSIKIEVIVEEDDDEDEKEEQKPTYQENKVEYKKPDETIGVMTIKTPIPTEPIKKERAFELLFRNRDSKIVKAFTPEEAIANANLSEEERQDFVGVELL